MLSSLYYVVVSSWYYQQKYQVGTCQLKTHFRF